MIPFVFIDYSADILGETNSGLSGSYIAAHCSKYAIEFNVDIPYHNYPFPKTLPNKRAALKDNLKAFLPEQQFKIIKDLCDLSQFKENKDVKNLKIKLISRYGHLASVGQSKNINEALIEETKHWLCDYPESLKLYQEALTKFENKIFQRNLLDDLRLSLEKLLKDILGNNKSLEKQVEEGTNEKLRQSEEQYRSLFNSMLEGFCIIEVIFDKEQHPIDYRFLEINPTFESQTGLHNAQGKLMREIAPDHEEHWFQIYGKVALTGEPIRFVNEAKALNRYYDVSAYRIGGKESRKVAILFNDISNHKRAEAELIKLASFPQHNPNPITELDFEGSIHYCNPAVFKLFPDLIRDGINHPWLTNWQSIVEEINLNNSLSIIREISVGDKCYLQTIHFVEETHQIRVYGTDITERKNAEFALKASEQKFYTTLASIGDAVIAADLNGIVTFINPVEEQLTGWSLEDAVNKPVKEIFNIVTEAQKTAIKSIEPGVKSSEIDAVARAVITEYGYGDAFIHSTGHGVGLEINEPPSLSRKDESVLEKGMVVTVEPGIYIEGEFGVRIEDMILIKNHAKVLNKIKTRFSF